MDGACWVCFCRRYSPVKDMNVRIFWVRAMECLFAQTRPRFILSPERVLGEWSQNSCYLQGKHPLCRKKNSPEENRTHDAAPSRTVSPTLPSELFRPLGHDLCVIWLHCTFAVGLFGRVRRGMRNTRTKDSLRNYTVHKKKRIFLILQLVTNCLTETRPI